jgi:hypothetical protein
MTLKRYTSRRASILACCMLEFIKFFSAYKPERRKAKGAFSHLLKPLENHQSTIQIRAFLLEARRLWRKYDQKGFIPDDKDGYENQSIGSSTILWYSLELWANWKHWNHKLPELFDSVTSVLCSLSKIEIADHRPQTHSNTQHATPLSFYAVGTFNIWFIGRQLWNLSQTNNRRSLIIIWR